MIKVIKNSKFYLLIVVAAIIVVIIAGVLIKYKFFPADTQYRLEVNLTPEQITQFESQKAQDFEQLKLFPKSYNAYIDLGNIERELGNASQAIKYFKLAWEAIPTNATPWLNIGNIYIALGDLLKAEEAFLKAKDIRKEYYLTYYNLANLYQHYYTKKADQVRGVYLEGLINTRNDYELLYHFWNYLIDTQNYSEAIEYLKVYINNAPDQTSKEDALKKLNEIDQLLNS